MWLKNSKGKKSATLTFSTIAFAVVMLKVLLANVAVVVGEKNINFGEMDPTLALTLLTPTLGAYVLRHWDKKSNEQVNEDEAK